ncbi:hypothetical protein HU200_028031 [Digitaria exilis]|uniref:Uncharacterized protein n=1 Tax=Digitaria exilis TaxID=1010633 RepID=A0A835C0V2_9POAL|nr:hypothetical protein HU200_028031 [Digitaria exilis]
MVFVTTIGSYSSQAKNLSNGRSTRSNPIVAGGHSWRIAFYPNGKLAGTAGFISLYLLLDDEVKGNPAAADDDIHVNLTVAGTSSASSASSPTTTSPRAFIKGDRFVIRCELTVLPASTPPAVDAPPPPKPSVARTAPPSSSTRTSRRSCLYGERRRQGCRRILDVSKEGADVELEVHGKVFAAHKSVLAARSSVFKEEFFGPTKEKDTSYVVINYNILPDAFEALLNYIYTDSLPEMMIMNNSLKGGALLAEDLLIAADRYNLKDLKSVIENRLCSHVGVSTVLPLLVIEEQYQCRKLRKMCLGFVGCDKNARAIMVTSNDVENLARSSPSVVKDVITEILDTSEARRRRLMNIWIWSSIYAFCFFFSLWPLVSWC